MTSNSTVAKAFRRIRGLGGRALLGVLGAVAVAGGLPDGLRAQEPAALTYAITGARIVPVAGDVIETGTVVFGNGLIVQAGADVAVPPGSVTIDGEGLTVYPGLIDMGAAAGVDMPPAPRADSPQTREDVERAKRALLARADLMAADHLDLGAEALEQRAAAGITTVLAVPSGDGIAGQSALIYSALPPDAPQVGAVADPRLGTAVVQTPVALHVRFANRPAGGNAYPNSLMGIIAFVRQTFLDAQHHEEALQFAAAHSQGTLPPLYDPALAALSPALAGRLPVAFEAESSREILRALDMANAFSLTPIITNGREAGQVTTDLQAADARVVLSLDYPTRPESLGPDAPEPLSVLKARADAPKTAGLLEKAGVTFAFMSGELDDPQDFVQHAAKAIESGLSRERALRALTLDAATIAGAASRLGSIEPGKIANLVVTNGDLFDEGTEIRYVFVAGAPVDLRESTEGSQRW